MNPLNVLSQEQLEQIHYSALKVLNEVGVKFHNEEALAILANAGARVEGSLVKIPQSLVEEALAKAPPQFSLYNRDMTDSFIWGGNAETYMGGAGSAVLLLDGDGMTYRQPTTKDLLNMYKIIDALPEIHWMAPGFIVGDVPIQIAGIWRYYLRLKYGKKASCADGLSKEDLMDNLDMLRVIRQDEKDFEMKPFSQLQSCPTPPLNWTLEGASFLVEGAKSKLPIVFIPMPFGGVGAPATIAGCIVQHVAETVSGLVLVQLISPGIPAVYAGAPAYMDMRYGSVVLSPMEVQMITLANTQIGRYYNLPTGTGDVTGHSDSKLNDFQCGVESALSQVLFCMAGNHAPCGIGFIASQEAYSLEKLVMDCEIYRAVQKLINGINISPETLAFEVFKEIGAGGEFLSHPHTMKWFKKECEFPEVFNSAPRTTWESMGKKDTHFYAREKVEQITANYTFNRLEPDVDAELDKKMDVILKRRGLGLSDFKHLLPKD